MIILFIAAWLIGSTLVGLYAEKKGLNVILYTTAATLLSPLLVGLWALTTEAKNVRNCPACAEQVKIEAKKCRHCQVELG